MDRWLKIAKLSITPNKRVKKLFDILVGFQFKYKDFYIFDENKIIVNEKAEIICAINTSSIIKQCQGKSVSSAVEIELNSLQKDLKIAKRYICIFNEVLNEEERKIAINIYFKKNHSKLNMYKDKYYRIVNSTNDKLVLAWRLFYYNDEGVINSYDDIENMVLESRNLLENINY